MIFMAFKELKVKQGKKINLKKFKTDYDGNYKKREKAEKDLVKYREKLFDLQYKLYADDRFAVLVVLQGIDAAGKDGVCRHVMSALNPNGVEVTPFKTPSSTELDHHFLWRIQKRIPAYGNIGIFNRSHYEDVLVVRVKKIVPKEAWKARYDQINNFEKNLYDNNVRILKFFLYISKDEQEERFLKRLLNPKKNWKFSFGDLKDRDLWDDYIEAFEDMLNKTSKDYAPWYVIPADKKWFRNIAVAKILVDFLEDLDLKWPKASKDVKDFARMAKKLNKLPPPPK
jgi:PPK2 family polyphosphate:nucleotide phosphotransferase